MSVQKEKTASALTRAVQVVLSQGLHDPRVKGMISVTRVSVSDDLADATVFVSILPAEDAELTMHGLKHATGHFRSEVAKKVALRRMPRLSFRLDDSLKREAQIIAAIGEARERDDALAPTEPETEQGEDQLP